jgi:hypothetical protein
MLTLVESRTKKAALQKRIQDALRRILPEPKVRLVGWRPHTQRMRISHSDRYWYTTKHDPSLAIPRYWNSFGRYDLNTEKKLSIAVEINIATTSNDGRISVFFARDTETGVTCLMHDGGVGGGKPGVNKHNFLWWTEPELEPVAGSNGKVRQGIVITPLDSKNAGENILRFVQSVIDFKQAADDGFRGPLEKYGDDDHDYYDEPAGKRKRRRIRELEYESRHGDIVRELNKWRKERLKAGEKIRKSKFIDLGVRTAGVLTEIYEVKSGCRRPYIYGGVGQILVHEAPDRRSKRYLVLPDDDDLRPDLARALDRNNINAIRFHMTGKVVRILA